MNFKTLRYFLVISETLNFSKAAEKLYISQQALSNCIKSLESELGVKLFNRRKNIALTYAGVRFMSYASEILSLEQRMRTEMEGLQSQEKGILRVSVNETRAAALMPAVMKHIYREFPYVEVTLIEGDAVRVSDSLLTNEADIGIGLGLRQSGILSETLISEHLCILIPKAILQSAIGEEYPQKLSELCSHFDIKQFKNVPLIMLNKTMPIRQWVDEYLAEESFLPNILFEATSLQTMFAMVCAGLGMGICTGSFLLSFQPELERNRGNLLVFPIYSVNRRNLCVFYRANNCQTEYSKRLIQLVKEYYSTNLMEYDSGNIIFIHKGEDLYDESRNCTEFSQNSHRKYC